MTTSRKFPEDQPRSKVRWADPAKAIELIDHLLETSEQDDDTSEWETLKALLDQDRLAGRKLFPNE
jgi:hypothetical protein